jgi:tmRNA-binding protein
LAPHPDPGGPAAPAVPLRPAGRCRRCLTLVPLKVYFNHGLAKGKKTYDRRESLKEKDAQMQIDRAMRRRR